MTNQSQKPKIYLETTLFNYYFLNNITRQGDIQATQQLFQEVQQKLFEPFVSDLTIKELSRCKDELQRNDMLDLINQYSITLLQPGQYIDFEKLASICIYQSALYQPKS